MIKFWLIFAAGVLCSSLAAWLTWRSIAEAEALASTRAFLSYSAVAEGGTLEVGEIITADDLASIELPVGAAENIDDALMEDTDENRRFVTLQPINDFLPRGRLLTYDLFSVREITRLDQVIDVGMRAITIPVNSSNSLNNRVVPNNRIDLLRVADAAAGTGAEVILADVEVIAVGGIFSYSEYLASGAGSYSTITLQVSPEDGLMLSTRREDQDGAFAVLLRNQCDTLVGSVIGCR